MGAESFGAALLVVSLSALACSNKPTTGVAPPREISHEAPPPVPPAEVLQQYEEAADLDPLRLVPLARHEGLGALLAEAEREPKHRRVVIAALPYTDRAAAVEYLATVVAGSEADRALALDAISELAARVSRNEDAEDWLELRRGCEILQKYAAEGKGSAEHRAHAGSCLRALAELGCAAPASPASE